MLLQAVLAASALAERYAADAPILDAALIAAHNADPHKSYTMEAHGRFAGVTRAEFGKMNGIALPLRQSPHKPDAPLETLGLGAAEAGIRKALADGLPDAHDPRDKWTWCPGLYQVRDQGMCGSCWSFPTTEALQDRFCTVANKTISTSNTDAAFCCDKANGCPGSYGCNGGDPWEIAVYANTSGLVDGACAPYDEGSHHCAPRPLPTPPTQCPTSCADDPVGGPAAFAKRKHHGTAPYHMPNNISLIKADLLAHGPAGSQMTVYADFVPYKTGVYDTDCMGQPQSGRCQPWGHGIQMYGWGHMPVNGTDTPYWWVRNSWCRTWGDDGFAKIIMGKNMVGVEGAIAPQLPYLG